jgi:hypothetical protein
VEIWALKGVEGTGIEGTGRCEKIDLKICSELGVKKSLQDSL